MGKKIDFYGQILILALIPAFLIGGIFNEGYFFIGFFLLLPLGLWQMISAAVHTYHAPEQTKKPLGNYWKACGISLTIFILAFFLRDSSENTVAMVVVFTGMSGGVLTALYYLYIYKKFLLNAKSTEENSGIGSLT